MLYDADMGAAVVDLCQRFLALGPAVERRTVYIGDPGSASISTNNLRGSDFKNEALGIQLTVNITHCIKVKYFDMVDTVKKKICWLYAWCFIFTTDFYFKWCGTRAQEKSWRSDNKISICFWPKNPARSWQQHGNPRRPLGDVGGERANGGAVWLLLGPVPVATPRTAREQRLHRRPRLETHEHRRM